MYKPPAEVVMAALTMEEPIKLLTEEGTLTAANKEKLQRGAQVIIKSTLHDASMERLAASKLYTSLARLPLNDKDTLRSLALTSG